jgi:hypothetical protein
VVVVVVVMVVVVAVVVVVWWWVVVKWCELPNAVILSSTREAAVELPVLCA